MKQINRKAVPFFLRPFAPDFWASSVQEIDFATLAREFGIEAVAFDIDSTLVAYKGLVVDPKTVEKIQQARHNKHIERVAIATNRRIFDFSDLLEQLGGNKQVVFVHARNFLDAKPWSPYYERLFRKLHHKRSEVLMVGDKLFTDIWGGNRSGMRTLHVERLGADSLLDKILPFRYLERFIANHYQKRTI